MGEVQRRLVLLIKSGQNFVLFPTSLTHAGCTNMKVVIVIYVSIRSEVLLKTIVFIDGV